MRVPFIDTMLVDLVERARSHPHPDVRPFLCHVAAHQYDPPYEALLRFVAPGGRVLDWGAGSGHFTVFLRASGYEPVPFSIQEIDREAWLPGEATPLLRGDDPARIPFEDASFDAVASIGVLEHVREVGVREETSLAEIVRVLRPGGIFLCAHLPCRLSWLEAIARRVPGKDHHIFRYGRAEVERLWTDAGLEILVLRSYGFLPRNLWRRFPRWLSDAAWLVRIWGGLDRALSALAPPLAENRLVVARRTVNPC